MSKNRFLQISESIHKIAKFKYFAKVITYSKFPDQVLQSYIYKYIHIYIYIYILEVQANFCMFLMVSGHCLSLFLMAHIL